MSPEEEAVLKEFIESLLKRQKALIDDLIVAKVTDPELSKSLTKEIRKIEVTLSELSDAETEGKLNEAVNRAAARFGGDA